MNIKLLINSIFIIIVLTSCSAIDYFEKHSAAFSFIENNTDQFSLLTYNIEAISEKEDGQLESLMTFVNNQKYDFVLFQEIFHEGSRDDIIELADTSFYKTIISRVDHNSFPEFFFQDAGLFMMSKYPRIDLSDLDFDGNIKNSNGSVFMILEKEFSRTYDFLANKSALGTLFDIGFNKKLFLFTTHTQALGSKENKEYQISQINDFMKTSIETVLSAQLVNKDDDLIIILAGDFNVDAYNNVWRENRVLHSDLLSILGNPRDLHKEYNGDKKEYTWNFRSNSYPRRFDYIFAFDSLAGFNFTKLSVNDISVVDIKDMNNNSISDHRGIETSLNHTDIEYKHVHKNAN